MFDCCSFCWLSHTSFSSFILAKLICPFLSAVIWSVFGGAKSIFPIRFAVFSYPAVLLWCTGSYICLLHFGEVPFPVSVFRGGLVSRSVSRM